MYASYISQKDKFEREEPCWLILALSFKECF